MAHLFDEQVKQVLSLLYDFLVRVVLDGVNLQAYHGSLEGDGWHIQSWVSLDKNVSK